MKGKLIDPKTLYFGQQHVGTVNLFGENYHTVPLTETPHYQLLLGKEDIYEDYLKQSWRIKRPKSNTVTKRLKKINSFKSLLNDIKFDGLKKPIQICRRMDGKQIILDGNHRASICLYLEKSVRATEVSMKQHIKKIIKIPDERWGTARNNKPYQSIIIDNKEIVNGRRDLKDLLSRFSLINPKDIENKNILDVGCNYGGNCFLTAEKGAKKVVGIDFSKNLITRAIRINTMLAQNCFFKNADFSKPNQLGDFDTLFVFSVDRHINNNKALADNILLNTSKIVYFETHSNRFIPNEVKEIFSKVTFLGKTGNSKRKFYRCEISDTVYREKIVKIGG
ncbi:methyltransferase domain-containing protein [Salipaludibacillus sp. HK11]|uniref:methyltransferase domain-containing protein n=1 Tax=Salipaludibacillus sp. HK11 TaxID=3394320 RepID=UPI0039FDBEE5